MRKIWFFWLILLFFLLFLLLFIWFLLGCLVYDSLFDICMVSDGVQYVGLDNFFCLFVDGVFWQLLVNNLFYILLMVVFGVIFVLLLVVVLSENYCVNCWLCIVFFFLMIILMVSVVVLWLFIFMFGFGLFDYYLVKLFGLMNNNWLGCSNSVLLVLVLIGVWKFVGYYMLFFFVGLQSILVLMWEVVLMEGVICMQVFFKVMLLLLCLILSFVIIIVLIYFIIQIDYVVVMICGGLDNVIIVLFYYIQNFVWDIYDFGKVFVVIFFILVGLFVFLLINLKLLEKGVYYEC